ncbi:hypothetical protein [Flavobacterium lindanitolerans]|uniref:hypothetical protein n=1 Tax=Flavobacterium lindanitolerans TaxID=428988 RepID=UPI002806785A|nr:hypothetical protein [Flavobacterium lindanitolerans]MDQ7960031.1 hypothetical protein [Flavobacterium lindanitolerans]
MKKLFILLISVASFISCSDPDAVTYSDKQAFVGFENDVYNLRVPRDASTELDVKFASSNVSNVDRTYTVTVLEDISDADTRTYSIPSTFTIPANQRFGTLRVTGTDNGLVDATVKKVVLKLSGLGANESSDSEILTIFVYEFCPIVVDDIVGLYDSQTWWLDGPATNEIVAGPTSNTLTILDFFDGPDGDFVITFDENNKVTFPDRRTGVLYQGGPDIKARMSSSPTQVSEIDACTGRITLWIDYYVPGVGGWGAQQEVFIKQ